MGKHRTGPPTYIIRASSGASTNICNFYATSYQSSHGIENFTPTMKVEHHGTGYEANFRPEIYYTARLDQFDNVVLGEEVKKSNVRQHMPSRELYSGKEDLPSRIVHRESAFTLKDGITKPNSKDVLRTRQETISANIYKPLLRRISMKKVPHLDDGSLVPKTEASTCYSGKPAVQINIREKRVGSMEPSGFTHYCPLDPISHQDRNPFDNERDDRTTTRTTATSAYKDHFLLWPKLTGNESNTRVRLRSNRTSGYCHDANITRFTANDAEGTSQTVRGTALPYIAKIQVIHSVDAKENAQASLSASNLEARNRSRRNMKSRASEPKVGKKEATGFSRNNLSHISTPDKRWQVLRNSKSGIISEKSRQCGLVPVIGTTKKMTGFSKSTTIHTFGDGLRFIPEMSFAGHHPHSAKAMKLAHPCIMENTRNIKFTRVKSK